MPSTPGAYNLRFFPNNSTTLLATSATITVQGSTPPPPSVTVTPTTVMVGAMVNVTVANGPGGATDWLGLVPVGAADWEYISVLYLNGSKTAPSTGLTNATFSFPMPTTGGAYNLRFFPSNTTTLLATSATITVNDTTAPAISAVAASSITASGGTIAWTTDEGSDSQVDYGTTTAYG